MSRSARNTRAVTVGQGGRSRLDVMTWQFPDGAVQDYDVFRFRAAAGVLPVDEEGNVYLIEEFAPGAEGWVTGLARGGIEVGESAEVAARRELSEEAGLACERLELLWEGLVAPNVSDWRVHLFVAYGLTHAGRSGGDEVGEVGLRKIPLGEALALVERGEIATALTGLAIALLAARQARLG